MKVFLEILKLDTEDNNYYLKKQIKKSSFEKAKESFNGLGIEIDEKKRIHKCYNDEEPCKPCELIHDP
jgi:hypothetical protein